MPTDDVPGSGLLELFFIWNKAFQANVLED